MKFMYVGDEAETTIFGYTFKRGEAVEVTDERAINKLKNSHLFTYDEEPEPASPAPEKRRGGRPPKVTDATE